ncbi:hypothetical protein [Pseudopontixanthobacter vadosimaris]|nr:hypothetical protein [Pseudopontixanthobacter vadosimaris]
METGHAGVLSSYDLRRLIDDHTSSKTPAAMSLMANQSKVSALPDSL